jgi:hypothetical protein
MIEQDTPYTRYLEKHIQAQFEKASITVGEQLAAQVLRAYEQGKVPASELYGLVNTIRQCGHANNSICDQLMQICDQYWEGQGMQKDPMVGMYGRL